MHVIRLAVLVTVGLSLPVLVDAQTTAYICTPDGQVLRQTIIEIPSASAAETTEVWYTGNRREAFDDCVVGPDGWLYIASGSSILRLDLSTPTAAGKAPLLSLVPSVARGLAFNVNTLYINTATTGVYALAGVAGSVDPLTFPNPIQALVNAGPGEGHGITFDVLGNLVVSSGNQVLRSIVTTVPPLYPPVASPLETPRPNTVFGTAINTCGQIVYADKASRSVISRAKDGSTLTVVASFKSPDYPVALEIDSNNNMYVVTAQADTGEAARVWKVAGSLGACAPAEPRLVVDLTSRVSGPLKLKGLLSARALGVAVAPTDAQLTRQFDAARCSNLYDFGYHSVRLTFGDCSVPFSVTIDALKSKPTEVNFDAALGPGVEGIRYSPMGGYIVQYILNDRVGSSAPFVFDAQYGFYTQETLGTPGIARAGTHGRTDAFSTNVMNDFWDVGVLDASGGERGDVFSKRVLYNSAPATLATDCTISAADWEQPLNSGNPLFKVGQSIKIAFTARTSTGAACGGGGTMRVSIAKVSPLPLRLLVTQSKGGAQTGNAMANSGDRYSFNLDSSAFGVGTFQLTVWGDMIAPTNRVFTIEQ